MPAPVRDRAAAAVAVAGTATMCAAMDLALEPYDAAQVEGHVLSRATLDDLLAGLAAVDPGLAASLQGLFRDLRFLTAGHGAVEAEQRSIAECMLLGDPVEDCRVLDWAIAGDAPPREGTQEIARRDRQQELACAMNNPAACAHVGKRLAAEVERVLD